MAAIDHLAIAAPDLERAIDALEAQLGVRPVLGGRHVDWGTRNALLGLGDGCYLEILAPDPERTNPDPPRLLDVERRAGPELATFVARTPDLDRAIAVARSHGVDLGAIRSGSRLRPDGTRVEWRITDPLMPRCDGIVPFFIDWGSSPHPSGSAPAGCTLLELAAEHPDAERVQAVLAALGVDVRVRPGPRARLRARIQSPRGVVDLG